MIEVSKIPKIIDHTNLKKEASEEDIKRTCQEAREFGFRGVCVFPKWASLVSEELKDTQIKVVILIDPPIGDSPTEKKVKESLKAKEDGATEIDVVMNIPLFKHERYEEVLKDLKEITKILPTKVIIGSGYLTDQEIAIASRIVKDSGAFCVKTATLKDPLEHRELPEKMWHLKIMKENASGLLIKAAGKIRTLEDAKLAIENGADIIGTSSSLEIVKEINLKKQI